MSARVAAFFDLDGTLLALPSLEWRFFRMLRHRGEIAPGNYFFWLGEAVKLLSRGMRAIVHGNKMYLRGVHSLVECGTRNQIDPRMSGHEREGRPPMPPPHNPRCPVPLFFEDGVRRVAWHAMQENAIVIVSGTLEPLAKVAARALEMELQARGLKVGIRVCATKLGEKDGRWTGRILGQAMLGRAKAHAILTLAREMNLDLRQSWAYGDSAQDRWMLRSVGNPAAVNPTPRLARIASQHGWPVLRTTNRVQLRPAERCP